MAGPRRWSDPLRASPARSRLAVLGACVLIALAGTAAVWSLAMAPASRDLACPSFPRAGISAAPDPAPRANSSEIRSTIAGECRIAQAELDTAVARYENTALGAMAAILLALLLGGCWWWSHALGRACAAGSVGFFVASLLLWSLYL